MRIEFPFKYSQIGGNETLEALCFLIPYILVSYIIQGPVGVDGDPDESPNDNEGSFIVSAFVVA
jgi:hypothetical protein